MVMNFCCCSVVQSCLTFCNPMQHTRLPSPSKSPRACSNSCPLSQWCHPTISSSVPVCSCFQSFPESGLFLMSWFCIRWPKYWSFSISPSDEYSGLIFFRIDWFELLAVKGILKRVSSSTTVWKHQLFGTQRSLWSNSHVRTWLPEKPQLWQDGLL